MADEGSLHYGDDTTGFEMGQYLWLSFLENEGSLHHGDINTN